MNQIVIKPYDVVIKVHLPELAVDRIPTDGDPLEIEKELYFVCEGDPGPQTDVLSIGVIPLVVRNPRNVTNISEYIQCLSLAHRKVQFKNTDGVCDLDHCDEMIISE
jgi:hypothetical protein